MKARTYQYTVEVMFDGSLEPDFIETIAGNHHEALCNALSLAEPRPIIGLEIVSVTSNKV